MGIKKGKRERAGQKMAQRIRQFMETAGGGPIKQEVLWRAIEQPGYQGPSTKQCAAIAGVTLIDDEWWIADRYMSHEALLIRAVLQREAAQREQERIDVVKSAKHEPEPESPQSRVLCPGCDIWFKTETWNDHRPAMLREVDEKHERKPHPGGRKQVLTVEDLPAGVVPDAIYRHDGELFAIDLPHGPTCPCGHVAVYHLRFVRLASGSYRYDQRRVDWAAEDLSAHERLSSEEQAGIGRRFGHCVAFRSFGRRCNARLSNPVSIERGMGPTCFGRYLSTHGQKAA